MRKHAKTTTTEAAVGKARWANVFSQNRLDRVTHSELTHGGARATFTVDINGEQHTAVRELEWPLRWK